jgi:5-methylcytosine-specific restriction protein A
MLKDDLFPTGKNRVIDLVQAAGVDVSDWGNYSRGPEHAPVNPKYCYEWSFMDPAGILVLNLWHRNIEERKGRVWSSLNMRRASQRLRAKGAKDVWVKRAARMDEAIQLAASKKWSVRVIVNDGDMRDANDPQAKASVVRRRLLDPMPWSITTYKSQSGDCVLERGVLDAPIVDLFLMLAPGSKDPEKVDVNGKAYLRSALVRLAALARAKGRCEYCRRPGFVTKSGDVFLETHHIIPLSEGGKDDVRNVAAVCANHHREAHYGAGAAQIRAHLLSVCSR